MTNIPVSLLNWKPLRRNTLQGFADVRIGKALIVREVAIHNGNGRRWASMPSKPQLKDGVLVKDEAGKGKYSPIIAWADRESADAFSAGVVDAVEREHPGATGG